MHNKSFTADNQATIIGGRNVGDEYFGAAVESFLFVDLDVLAVGPVVTEVSEDFNRYWNSPSSYPADRLLPAASPAQLAEVNSAAMRVEKNPAAVAYMNARHNSPFVHQLIEGSLDLEWAATRLISDDPAKGLGLAAPERLFPQQLKELIGEPATDLELVAAYFVPTVVGVDSFVSLAKRGVKVRILTNSLEATDGPYVHAGYAKRRKPLLEAGITLFELRRLSPEAGKNKNAGPMGSSGSSLHAETFSVDGSRAFVGSFNFDPRSAKLNTELGFVIESPPLAQRIEETFSNTIPDNSYEVHLSDTGKLYWTGVPQRKAGAV